MIVARRAALAEQSQASGVWVPKVGDRVRIVALANIGISPNGYTIGQVGTVSKANPFIPGTHIKECSGHYAVFLDGRELGVWCKVELVEAATASAPPAPQPPDNRNARHCDKCMNPVVGGTLCAEHVKGLGKPVEAKRDPYADARKVAAERIGYTTPLTVEQFEYVVTQRTEGESALTRAAAFPSRERRRVEVLHPEAWPEDSGDSYELGSA